MATCLRCGAPGNPVMRGGRLVPVTGLRHGRRHLWQHSDRAYCERRIPSPRRRPTDPTPFSTEVKR